MRRFGGLMLILALTGCTTVEFVRKDFSPQKQGVLRSDPASSDRQKEKNAAEIDRQAREFCGGAYHITREYQSREDAGVSTGVGTGMSVGMGGVFVGGANRSQRMFNYTEFTCQEGSPFPTSPAK